MQQYHLIVTGIVKITGNIPQRLQISAVAPACNDIHERGAYTSIKTIKSVIGLQQRNFPNHSIDTYADKCGYK